MQRAVPRRRAEFATGRWCARQALAQLHLAPGPIVVGPWRNPVWPDQLTGSISHTTDVCAAVVAHRTTWKAIGIDLLDRESAARLPVDAGRLLAHPHDADPPPSTLPVWVPPLVLQFSAKEAAIKALSPMLQRVIDFPELRVQFDESTFTAALDAGDTRVVGWWTIVMDQLILTGAALL
jgi:4'-phosphopantetheinyl transferase EntD